MSKKSTTSAAAQSDAVAALQATVQGLGSSYKHAEQVIKATDAALQAGKLPASLSEQERAGFLTTLEALRQSTHQLRAVGEKIEAAVPQIKQDIEAQKAQIEVDFNAFTGSLEQTKQQQLEEISKRENVLKHELSELEKAYKQKKAELKSKLKQCADEKKGVESTTGDKKKAAAAAKQKAIAETQQHPPQYDPSLIDQARAAQTQLVTELNKTKGHLQSIFASPQDAETLKAILGG